jgi:hypothetical protein
LIPALHKPGEELLVKLLHRLRVPRLEARCPPAQRIALRIHLMGIL